MKDDPRKFELYELTVTTKNMTGNMEQITKKYEPLLTALNPTLFKKQCKANGECTLIPLFPEDQDSNYKQVEGDGSKYTVALLYKKICHLNRRTKLKVCAMEQLVSQDNAREYSIFEKINTKDSVKDSNGDEKEEVLRHYNPIIPEIEGKIYFKKACNNKTKSCAMKPLYDDKDAIFRQMTVINPKTDERMNEYASVNIYSKVCKNNDSCEFILLSPKDKFKDVPLFEMTIKRTSGIKDPKTNKEVSGTEKTYNSLPKSGAYELYKKSCAGSHECVYIPLVEDDDTLYRMFILKKKAPKFIPVRLYKKNCPDGEDKPCTMDKIGPDDLFPDEVHEAIYFKKKKKDKTNPDGAPEEPEAAGPDELSKVYVALSPDEVAKIYKKVCSDGTTKCMKPVRKDTIYKLSIVPKDKNGPNADKVNDTKEFSPIAVYKKVCDKETNKCNMKPFTPADDPVETQIYELTATEKSEGEEKTVTTKKYDPISPETLTKLFRKECAEDSSTCELVPLIEANIYIRSVIKKINDLPKGELEEERTEMYQPILVYKQVRVRTYFS
jgi:hypothetical protein